MLTSGCQVKIKEVVSKQENKGKRSVSGVMMKSTCRVAFMLLSYLTGKVKTEACNITYESKDCMRAKFPKKYTITQYQITLQWKLYFIPVAYLAYVTQISLVSILHNIYTVSRNLNPRVTRSYLTLVHLACPGQRRRHQYSDVRTQPLYSQLLSWGYKPCVSLLYLLIHESSMNLCIILAGKNICIHTHRI